VAVTVTVAPVASPPYVAPFAEDMSARFNPAVTVVSSTNFFIVLMTHLQAHESVRSLLTAFEKATTVRPAVGDRTKQAKLLVPMCKKSSIQKAFSKRDARLLKLADEAKIPYQTLINRYLRDCAAQRKELRLEWRPSSS
jgi:hypothetical protein